MSEETRKVIMRLRLKAKKAELGGNRRILNEAADAVEALQQQLSVERNVNDEGAEIVGELKHQLSEAEAAKRELVSRLRNSNSKMRKAKDDLSPETNCVAIARLSKAMEANAIAIAKHSTTDSKG